VVLWRVTLFRVPPAGFEFELLLAPLTNREDKCPAAIGATELPSEDKVNEAKEAEAKVALSVNDTALVKLVGASTEKLVARLDIFT
jgi:hypothetical protein